jgi:hypothetical protein
MQKEYEANEAKMLADWRMAMKDAQSGELDAAKLDHEVQDLRQEIQQNQGVLAGWDRQLVDELARRGAANSER